MLAVLLVSYRKLQIFGRVGSNRPNPYKTVVVIVFVEASAPRAKFSSLTPGYFTLNGDKAPPATRDSDEVARS